MFTVREVAGDTYSALYSVFVIAYPVMLFGSGCGLIHSFGWQGAGGAPGLLPEKTIDEGNMAIINFAGYQQDTVGGMVIVVVKATQRLPVEGLYVLGFGVPAIGCCLPNR